MALRPWPYQARFGLGPELVAGVLTGGLLLGAAALLERTLPSFRYASTLMENALRSVRLPWWMALLLAAATSGSEELFFRGGLLPLVGLVPQALLFGLFHPVPRRAWAYPAFAAVAGLAFGELTLVSGSLLPSLVAHVTINLQGLWEARRQPAGSPGDAPVRLGQGGPGYDAPNEDTGEAFGASGVPLPAPGAELPRPTATPTGGMTGDGLGGDGTSGDRASNDDARDAGAGADAEDRPAPAAPREP